MSDLEKGERGLRTVNNNELGDTGTDSAISTSPRAPVVASSTGHSKRFRLPFLGKAKVDPKRTKKEENPINVQVRPEQHLTQDEADEKPWKYIGYQGYTDFIASDNDFFVLRRFASVSARVALSLQDQVTVLEEQLNELDWKYSRKEEEDVNNGTFRDDDDERAELLESLRLKILQYNEFVLQQAQIKKHPTASPQDIRNLHNWHYNHQYRAIDTAEQAYLSHTRDLFSVIPKDKTPLRRLLERSASFRIHWLWREEKPPDLPLYDRDDVKYTSDKKINAFTTILILTVGVAMIVAPMWILEYQNTPAIKLGTITAFVVAFLGMISYASVAKPFEVLAATAAYSAVLMVFLQLNNPNPAP